MGININNDRLVDANLGVDSGSVVSERVADLLRLHELDCSYCGHHGMLHAVDACQHETAVPLPCRIQYCDCKDFKKMDNLELFALIEKELEKL